MAARSLSCPVLAARPAAHHQVGDFASIAIAAIRREAAPRPFDPQLTALVEELRTGDPDAARWWDDHTVGDYAQSRSRSTIRKRASCPSTSKSSALWTDLTSGWSSTPSSRTPLQPACSHSSQAGKHNPLRHSGGRCESPLDYPDDLTDDHVERCLLSGGDELYADPSEKSEH